MIIESGKTLVRSDSYRFFKLSKQYQNNESSTVKEILVRIYSELDARFSDDLINWILSDITLLDIGKDFKEPKWFPTSQLILQHSSSCSIELFKRLEKLLYFYKSLDILEEAKYCLKRTREGYYLFWHGECQYFLLPALSKSRRTKATNEYIRVLKRKFSKYDEDTFKRSAINSTGGWIGSPLEKPWEISDKAWLKIISNKKIKDSSTKWKQKSPDHATESSIRHFSNSLENAASKDPNRFLSLALTFPEHTHERYLSSILSAAKLLKPPDKPEEFKSDWEPASIANIEDFLKTYKCINDRQFAIDFCWMVKDRSNEDWSSSTIDQLFEYALFQTDPEPDIFPITSSNYDVESIQSLRTNALNSVRSVAIMAIGSVLYSKQEIYKSHNVQLQSLLKEKHPAVIISLVFIFLPLLNINKDLAVEWFVHLCKSDLRVAATSYAANFFNYTFKDYYEKLAPIIRLMINSKNGEIVEEGASEVCARWLFNGFFEKDIEICISGNLYQRKGVSKIVSYFLSEDEYSKKCIPILKKLLNDKEKDVRNEIQNNFRRKEFLSNNNFSAYLDIYVKSLTFVDDPSPLLYSLKDYPASLIIFAKNIFTICDVFIEKLLDDSRNIQTSYSADADTLSKLVIRLYEQTSNNKYEKLNTKCLDYIDLILENRLGYNPNILEKISE